MQFSQPPALSGMVQKQKQKQKTLIATDVGLMLNNNMLIR